MTQPEERQELGVLREPWAAALSDPVLVNALEEVLQLVTDLDAERRALPGERHLRAVGRDVAWTGQWIVQVTQSWRAAEELEVWEDRLLTEAEAVAVEVEALSSFLLAGEPVSAQLGDGLRAWRLCHLGHARGAVVRLLHALEQSVERDGGHDDADLALQGELEAAEQALRTAADELRGLGGLSHAAEVLPQLLASVERLHAARDACAAGAQVRREERAVRRARPTAPAEATEPFTDPAVPLPLLALDLLVQRLSSHERNRVQELVAAEVARRVEWAEHSLHPEAIAALVVGDLLAPDRRRQTLKRLGRELAAGRAAARLLSTLHRPPPPIRGNHGSTRKSGFRRRDHTLGGGSLPPGAPGTLPEPHHGHDIERGRQR